MKLNKNPKNKKTVLFISGIFLLALLVIWAIPMTFKPSLLTLLYPRYVEKSFDQSKDSVYLPSGDYRRYSTFTSYSGWQDAYEVRYHHVRPVGSPTEFVDILQFNQNAITTRGITGPPEDMVRSFRAATTSKNCKIVDSEKSVRLCDNAYLLRDFMVGDSKISAVAKYYPISSEKGVEEPLGNNIGLQVLLTLEPVALDKARNTYFKFKQYWSVF
jgi:hypothetical protein